MALRLLKQSGVAVALNVSKQTVSGWKAAGCPHLQQAPFDVAKIEERIKANIRPEKVARTRNNDAIGQSEWKQEAETRMKELTAENMELHNAIGRGGLILAADWKRTLRHSVGYASA